MLPSAPLLDQLRNARLRPRLARASVGIGERQSGRKGAGMEFVDYRPYVAGDDTRHLDPYLYARTGQHMLREYAVGKQLPITVVVDASLSMTTKDKAAGSRLLAQLFGFVGLTGGDRVQVAISTTEGPSLSPRWHGAARAEQMFAWMDETSKRPGTNLLPHLRALRPNLDRRGLVIIISDWWEEGIESVLSDYAVSGLDVLAIQLLDPAEIDPSQYREEMILVDMENDEELTIAIDDGVVAQYRDLFAARQRELTALFHRRGWTFLTVSTADDPALLFTRTLPAEGLLS